MSHWNGRMGRGAGRRVRELKREQAAARQVKPDNQAILYAERQRRIMAYQAGYDAGMRGDAAPDGGRAPISWLNGYDAARRIIGNHT